MTHTRFAYHQARLDVDLPLAPGITALAGPSAAGKSLLLATIAGFERPDTGRILIDDAIVFDAAAKVNLAPRRRRAAWIGQAPTLFDKTAKQNLMFAAQHWARLERHKRVAEMADRFELAAVVDSQPAALSPRQTLNCEIARALLSEPKLLLIDDRGIDEPQLDCIRAIFSGPVFIVTSDLDLCYAAADHLILLEAGRIVQRGPARDVIEHPANIEAARLLGFANIFPAEIVELDPGRDTSLLHCDGFDLTAPYLPQRFKGDRVTVAIRAEDVRVHIGSLAPGANGVPVDLARVSERSRRVRLEFSRGLIAEISREQWEKQRDNRSWQVELPSAALRVF
jgi:ABC-type sulfate/molybdate transport systems ATPase subunit